MLSQEWSQQGLNAMGKLVADILLENHIGRFVADAEAIYSYEGTREMNTLIVGKSITGLSAFV
jgi:alkylation response protein AidB-like acyl-CoA dehydrogenase